MFKGMSRKEQVLYFKLGEDNIRIFTIDDIVRILNVSKPQARNMASSMVKKNAIERIRPGHYVRIPESVILSKDKFREDSILIASGLTGEYFLSHSTASFVHGLSDSFSSMVYVSSPSHQRDLRYHDIQIRFVSVSRDRMFGLERVDYFENKIVVSDLERTMIDLVDRPNLSGGWHEVIGILRNIEGIRIDDLVKYLIRFDNRKTTRIMGFLLENIMGLEGEELHSILMRISGHGRYYMDRYEHGRLDRRWDLIVPDMISGEFIVR